MGRVLFVALPFEARVNLIVSVERALAARGHATAYIAHEGMRPRLPPAADVYPIAEPLAPDLGRDAALPWVLGMRALIERTLIPLAARTLPQVERALDLFAPDLVVTDQHAYAGAFAARKRGLRFVTSAPSGMPLEPALLQLAPVRAWWHDKLAQAQRDAGLDTVETTELSPDLVLIYVSREFAGADRAFPDHYRFVGPAWTGRRDDTPFPWARLGEGPRLLVSFGTILAGTMGGFYAKLADALADEPVQVIVSAPPGSVPREPANFIVVPRVPMMAVLPRVDALLCHAGGTAIEALAHGLPLVLAPIAHDQPTYARLASDAGAAVLVRHLRVTAEELRAAVRKALHDPQMRASAQRVQASFAAAGGAEAAASAIEALL